MFLEWYFRGSGWSLCVIKILAVPFTESVPLIYLTVIFNFEIFIFSCFKNIRLEAAFKERFGE